MSFDGSFTYPALITPDIRPPVAPAIYDLISRHSALSAINSPFAVARLGRKLSLCPRVPHQSNSSHPQQTNLCYSTGALASFRQRVIAPDAIRARLSGLTDPPHHQPSTREIHTTWSVPHALCCTRIFR